jgi:hypothetical protein
MGSTWEEQKQDLIKKKGYPPKYLEKYEKSIGYKADNQTGQPTRRGFLNFVEAEYPAKETTTIRENNNPEGLLTLDLNPSQTCHDLKPQTQTPETFESIAREYEQELKDPIFKGFSSIERLLTVEDLTAFIVKAVADNKACDFLQDGPEANCAVQNLLKYYFLRACEELKIIDKNTIRETQSELDHKNLKIPTQIGIIALTPRLIEAWAFSAYRVAQHLNTSIPQQTDKYDLILKEFKAKLSKGTAIIGRWITALGTDDSKALRQEINDALGRDNPPTATTPSTPSTPSESLSPKLALWMLAQQDRCFSS